MSARDIALIAYRLLALWVSTSGLMVLSETLLTWKSLWAESQAAFAGVINAPTETGFFLATTSALVARVLIGVLLWWAAPTLARYTAVCESSRATQEPPRAALYSAAAFLVGVWLLSQSLPGLAFGAYAATRPGVPAYDDGLAGARMAELIAQCILGVAFVRGGWLVDVALWSRGGAAGSGDETPGV